MQKKIYPYRELFRKFLKEEDIEEIYLKNLQKYNRIEEQYNKLSEEFKDEGFDIIDKDIAKFYQTHLKYSYLIPEENIISSSFPWFLTEEGNDYWSNLDDKWKDYIKTNSND